jgi:predicted Zn finger-like uncharacterized protein
VPFERPTPPRPIAKFYLMYSQCPDCLTRFRVTADALRAAQGTVRCGQCGSAFDALTRLSDTIPARDSGHQRADEQTGTQPAAGANENLEQVEYHFSVDDIEKVFIDARAWDLQFESEVSADPALQVAGYDAGAPVIVVEDSDSFEDITLETRPVETGMPGSPDGAEPDSEEAADFDPDATDEVEILQDVPDSAYPDAEESAREERTDSTPAATETDALDVHVPGASAAQEQRLTPTGEATETGLYRSLRPELVPAAANWGSEAIGAGVDSTLGEFDVDELQADQGRSRALAWTVGSVALALLLLVQITHHYRQELVRHPQIGPSLRKLYEGAGLTLSPNWDVSAFELRQWGTNGTADAEGKISVRASISNQAAFAQPYPLLRLELEDRFGATVAAREFGPAEYLKNPGKANRLMDPGASTEAELLVADPGSDAVGYRLEVCLRESQTRLRCARGPD